MALWSNTASGWGSDPSSSGNGALAAYLQSSAASSPKSQSGTQAQDPSNSAPTSSIARTVQPARTNTLVQSVMAQPVVQAAPAAQPSTFGVSRFQANIAPQAGANFTAPTPVTNAVEYAGPKTVVGQVINGGSVNQQYSVFNPTTGAYQLDGYRDGKTGNYYKSDGTVLTGQAANDYVVNLNKGQQQFANDRERGAAQIGAGANTAGYGNQNFASQIQAYRDGQTVVTKQNQASLQTAQDAAYRKTVMDYLLAHNGQLPYIPSNSLAAGNLAAIQQDALAEYQANKTSAAAISRGIAPVDTSTQDAINTASLNALSSRFSTNAYGNNIANAARMYAQAAVDQGGVNKQLSDEDYAARFNQNQAQFAAAVQNQATLDANATGTKLQSDVQAISDSVDKLNQQVGQLNSRTSQVVQAHLLDLQKMINAYNEAVSKFGNESSLATGIAKGLLGAAAAVTSIALAPVTGGGSLAAGVAAGTAIAKA